MVLVEVSGRGNRCLIAVGGWDQRREMPVRRVGLSEGDVVVGFVVGFVVLGVGEAVDVEGEVVVEAEELLAGMEVHVKQQGCRLALGHGVA